jgi:hypothetical protein
MRLFLVAFLAQISGEFFCDGGPAAFVALGDVADGEALVREDEFAFVAMIKELDGDERGRMVGGGPGENELRGRIDDLVGAGVHILGGRSS